MATWLKIGIGILLFLLLMDIMTLGLDNIGKFIPPIIVFGQFPYFLLVLYINWFFFFF